jgi:hypothetical protein
MPVVVLPVAYALTFGTQTLSAEDVERVRQMGKLRAAKEEAAVDTPTDDAVTPL